MIHTATSTAKFRRLSRALAAAYGCSRSVADTLAVGHLERLWHLTINSAKRGDIGQLSDVEIADEIGWERDPEELIAMLLELGWLDPSEEHRLVVHDWAEHCPGFIKRNIGRVGGFVAGDGKGPLNESAEITSDRLMTHEAQETFNLSAQERTPNLTQPNPTKVDASASCSKTAPPSLEPDPSDDVVMEFLVKGDPDRPFWGLRKSKVAEYAESFPGVDTVAELLKARQWCRDNRSRRKTARGMPKFLGNWFATAQNEAMRTQRGSPPGVTSRPDRNGNLPATGDDLEQAFSSHD